MLGSELGSRARRLEQESRARVAKERDKAAREAKVAELVKARQQQREAEASRRRAAAIAAEELERAAHEEELEHNQGVWWQASLAVVPLPATAAAEKGIRRSADKILLPPSAGAQLMAQDAPKNGAMFFQLALPGGRATHAGLLDFSAPEGRVGIPPAVAASLWPELRDGEEAVPQGQALTVTYRRLEKGTFARLQPLAATFQQEVGEAMEETLVAALSQRSAVSEGDLLAVPFGEATHTLRVQQLLPARAVSVIDTEMEADVEPSLETAERLAREAAEAAAAKAQQRAAEAAAEAERQAAAEAALAEAGRRAALQQELAASLPPEAPQGEPATLCQVRFPDGSRHVRRFRHSEPLALLFQYVDSEGAGGCPPGGYRLVTQFPRRALSSSFGGSVAEAGLDPRQEALLLEPLGAAS